MTDAPFGPFSDDSPGPDARHRPPQRPWQRAIRCPEAGRRRGEASMDRFEGYVALHAAVSAGPEINTVRLWAGGLGTAVVASLMTLTGGLIARDIFGVPVPAPMSARADVAVAATTYALCAAALALQATALLHVLLAVWPRPVRLFACISGSIALLTVLAPFALQVSPEAEVATAAINMLTGIVIVGLLCSTASAALWPRPPRLDLRDF